MNSYSLAAIVSLSLCIMGTVALLLGLKTFMENVRSRSGLWMFISCASVFAWDVGYGLMGLCYDDDFAYAPRAVALFSVFVYMGAILVYVSKVAKYNLNITRKFIFVTGAMYLVAWFFIIQKDAVSFTTTSWGYWYTSKMSWARIVQFASVIATIVMFYVIVIDWKNRVTLKKEKALINRFILFGPVMFVGYLFDTLFPSVFSTAAVPGSSIAAFVSAMMLYSISVKYKAFGISITNVAEYVFNEVNTTVLVLNRNDEIVLYNEMASSFFGVSEGELEGKTLTQLLDVLDDESILSDSKYQTIIYQVKGKNELYCKLERSIIYDDFGEVQYVIVFVPDMTAAVISVRALQESRREAQEASMAKSSFLANMSHEIRTPMNAIIGMSDILLRDNEFDADTREHLKNIKEAGNGLLGIINDILDLSKIESGKYELICDDYDVPSLINDVSTIIQVRLAETPVELIVSVDGDIPATLYGDELRIRQILMNLLGNAIKFTHKGSISLICKCEMKDDECVIHFDIKDTGIGIKPENLDTIFGAFNQVDTRRNRNIQGTGLGLAISKNLAIMMGGDITVESVYEEGSTFHLTIVQKCSNYKAIGTEIADSLRQKIYRRDEAKDDWTVVERPDKKILVVDDSRVNIIVAKGLLKPYKMQVDMADSGVKAIEMVSNNDYDLIFMDHMMPELDGVDTTHIIRSFEDEKYQKLVIIALTANAVSGTKDMLIKEGMQDFLAKPIEKKALNDILDKWL